MSIEGKKGKIELNLDTSKKLYEGSPEDIILKSPYRIPAKGINNVLALKGINNQEYAYYDISKTENQAIYSSFQIKEEIYKVKGYNDSEKNMLMDNFQDS